MALPWPDKDPDEVLDFKVNWTNALTGGDTISSSTWIVPSGLTQDSTSFDDTTTTIWLSGGVLDTEYSVVNRITTAAGRTFDQTLTVTIAAK